MSKRRNPQDKARIVMEYFSTNITAAELYRKHNVLPGGGGGLYCIASRPEGWPWSCGQPGGGQLQGGICVFFPSVCRVPASGLRWRFRVFLLPAVQSGSVGIRPPSVAYFRPGQPAMAGVGVHGHQSRNGLGPETASQKAGFYM